jgi:hypothetical protein
MSPLRHHQSVVSAQLTVRRFYQELCRWAEIHRLSHVRYHRRHVVLSVFLALASLTAGTTDVGNLVSQLVLTPGIDAPRIALFSVSIFVAYVSVVLGQISQALSYKARATFHEEKNTKFMELAIALQGATSAATDEAYDEIRDRVRDAYIALIPDNMQCDDDLVQTVSWTGIAARYEVHGLLGLTPDETVQHQTPAVAPEPTAP